MSSSRISARRSGRLPARSVITILFSFLQNFQSAFQNVTVGHIFIAHRLFGAQQPLQVDGADCQTIHIDRLGILH